MQQFKLGVVTLCCILASACSSETTNSDLVKTEAIWSDIYVTSDGTDSRVIAELNVSSRNGNNLNLVSGDKLSVTAKNSAISANMTKDMDKDVDFFDIDYRATFPYYQADTKYDVKLYRAKDNVTLTSTVTLPEPIMTLAPQKEQTFSVDEIVEVNWTKALKISGDQSLNLQLLSTCKRGDKEITSAYTFSDIQDDGQKSIDFEAIGLFNDPELNSNYNCSVKFEFERKRYGTVDARYASGSRAYAKTHATIDKINIKLK